MTRIIRFLIVGLIVWAAYHAGMAQWQQFQFSDALQQIAQFGPDQDEAAVRTAVMDAGVKFGVSLDPQRVSVRKLNEHLYIDVSYTVQIEVLPRYKYPWNFEANAHGWFVPGGRK
jgi:hypothetical protein